MTVAIIEAMRKFLILAGVAVVALLAAIRVGAIQLPDPWKVGSIEQGGVVVPSSQIVQPAGTRISLPARPLDIVRRPSDGAIFIKTVNSVAQLDPKTGEVVSKAALNHGASLHGFALSHDGSLLLATDANSALHIFNVVGPAKEIGVVSFPNAPVGGVAYACGVAFSEDDKTAYVCLSRSNQLVSVDVESKKITGTAAVPPAPFDVAISGHTAVVTCWGQQPAAKDLRATSSGTAVKVDERGVAVGGTLCFIDLNNGLGTDGSAFEVLTGRQPSQVVTSSSGLAYIPDASDDIVQEWSVKEKKVLRTLKLSPDSLKGLGVAPNALTLSPDEKTLYVACGGINSIGIVDLTQKDLQTKGYVAADWYPIGVIASADQLWAVNAKGIGSRNDQTDKHSVYSFSGTASTYKLPLTDLPSLTKQALAQATVMLGETEVPTTSPLFNSPSQPSPIKHVFYIIKENRTYDQILGDVPQGDGDPKLVNFGEKYTPNIHALAKRFVLLDNFYCNGVNSADGHSWATEGNASSYFERSFGGFTRSYPFVVDDPLAPTATGFIWNNALKHGKTFRNYGESDYAGTSLKFAQVLAEFKAGKRTQFTQNIPVDSLRSMSQRDYPGWNLEIPDEVRAHRFIDDFEARVQAGTVPDLNIIYLPEDHTGASVSPGTCVADNDLGVGLVVQAISHSKIWASSAIFVVEDDAQAGVDHVDGHRSPCLVISPYTALGKTVSSFYSQGSVLHTMEQILGLPPMNRMDAVAPIMVAVFQSPPDLAPYDAVNETVAVTRQPEFMRKAALNVSKPDQVDEKLMNRLVWRAMRPNDPYPSAFEGGHGKGLAARGLVLEKLGIQPDHDGDGD